MSRRKLTDADQRDWDKVTNSVRPLERRTVPVKPAKAQQKTAVEKYKTDTPQKPVPKKPRATPVPPMPVQTRSPAVKTPGIDQFGMRKIKREKGPDARIDLHGMTQTEAHHRLLVFLRNAQASGARIVLVITGKGRSDPQQDWWSESERGVLRRAVPGWLNTPPFRPLVSGYQSAARGHGGEGAFYVQLRRAGRGGKDRT